MREPEDYTLEIAALLAQVRPPDLCYRTVDASEPVWFLWRSGGLVEKPMVTVGKDPNQDWNMLPVGLGRRHRQVHGYQKILESFADPEFRKRWNLNDPTREEEEDQHGRRETSDP